MKIFLWIILLGIITSLPLQSVDPHYWPNDPARNMVSDATGLPVEFTDDNLLWRTPFSCRFQYTQPTISQYRILLGGDSGILFDPYLRDAEGNTYARSGLVCLDLLTGQLVWEIADEREGDGYGICSQPVVEDQNVYLVGSGTRALCLDLQGWEQGTGASYLDAKSLLPKDVRDKLPELPETYGAIRWVQDLRAKFGVGYFDAHSGSPLIDGDYLWVPTCNNSSVGSPGTWYRDPSLWKPEHKPNLVVLDKRTGELIARDAVDIPMVFHGQWCSASMGVVNGVPLVFWGDGYGILHAFARPERPSKSGEIATLREVWHYDCNPPEYRAIPHPLHNGPTRTRERLEGGPSHIIATPVFYRNRVYVTIGRDLWGCWQEGGHSAGKNGRLLCIDATQTGDVTDKATVWDFREIGRSMSTVSISDGLLFIGDLAGKLYCLNADTGKKYWEQYLGGPVYCRSQLVADGKVYVQSDRNNMLWVFRAGKEKDILSKTRMDTLCTPAAVNGLMILAGPKGAAAYTGPGFEPPGDK